MEQFQKPLLDTILLAFRTEVRRVKPSGTRRLLCEVPLFMATQVLHTVASIISILPNLPCNARRTINLSLVRRAWIDRRFSSSTGF